MRESLVLCVGQFRPIQLWLLRRMALQQLSIPWALTLAASMGTHPGHADLEVQEYGCLSLVNLAGNADNKVAIAAQDGIEAVVAAMFAHPGHVEVQKQGCWSQGNIKLSQLDLQTHIKREGGTEVVQLAVAVTNTKTKEEGQLLLGNLKGL